MDIQWMEVMRESRGFSISDNSVSKKFSFIVQSEDFLNFADNEPFPGDSNLILYYDDQVMQEEIIPLFYSLAPLAYRFSVAPGQYIVLYCVDLQAEQINWKTWKIDVTYDLPPDNGQSRGGGGGDSGPSNGEANSVEFTQLSFDCSIDYENSQVGVLIEEQSTIAIGDVGITVLAGKTRRVGVTEDGIKGFDVPVRKFGFEITQYMSPTKMGYSYMRRLSKLTTSLNNQPFFGFASLSVLCTGAGASGHLYQNIPVSLRFEVKPNIKLVTSLPNNANAVSAPIAETFIILPNGKKVVQTALQYDQIKVEGFPDTISTHWSTYGLAPGVHSGWSHIEYLYFEVIDTPRKSIIRTPSYRSIYMPPRVCFANFNDFLL